MEVVIVDEALSWDAGALGGGVANLSLGDRLCLALARRMKQPVYTTDPTLEQAAVVLGVQVVVVR